MRQFLKRRFFARRLLALLVTGCVLMSFLSGCAGERSLEPTALSFSQVEYERPDGQAVLDLIEQAQEKAQNDWLPFGLIFSLRRISKATQDFYSMMTIAQIRNYADMSDRFYSEEMDYLNTWDARIQNSYSELFTMIEQSRFGSLTGDIFGESASEDLQMSASASSADILSLQEQEKQLEAQYYEEYANATVTTPEGEVLYSELEPEGQEAYYSQFIEKYNQQLGELYRQLVELRQQMAQLLGYESYTEVADLDMLRVGYTREDIRQFREDLKQTLTPVYRAYLEDFYSRAENRTQPGVVYLLGDPAPSPQGSWQQTLQSLEEVYNRMQEQTQGALALQTGDCYSYLLSHEMIDAAPSSVKANVTFSTLIYSLNTPFLFANMDGSAEDVFSVSHEFGHCYAMWRQLQQGSHEEGRSMDVCEIHSQAMQILTMPFYEESYGEEAGAARRYDVYTVVAGILTAALNDEFQEEVYANPDLTVEQLNELYASLAAEYGLVVDSPYFDMDSFSKGWFTTNQYFDSPFYAIDYALSGCVAMQFLQMGLQDYGASLKTYEALVTQSADDSFLTVLEAVGLDSPFAVETLEQTAQTLQTFLEGDGSFAAADAVQQDADAA